jgi:hypothetical protein
MWLRQKHYLQELTLDWDSDRCDMDVMREDNVPKSF